MGMLLGLDPLVSQSFGAGRPDECRRWLLQGVYLALILADPLDGWRLPARRQPGSVAHERGRAPADASLSTRVVAWSILPLLVYFAFRRYLQNVGGHPADHADPHRGERVERGRQLDVDQRSARRAGDGGGGRRLGNGAVEVAMAASLLVVIVVRERQSAPSVRISWRLDLQRIPELAVLGFPAAMQLTLEVGVFAAASARTGRMLPVSPRRANR